MARSGPTTGGSERAGSRVQCGQPDVVVRAEYQGSYGDLQTKLIAAVSAGALTVSLVYNNWTAAFLDAGALVPVEQFFDHGSTV